MNQLYETFVQIVEHETLVKAAAALHVTQPTVSRQVQQLEQNLDMPLFDRVGKRLVLNHAGQIVYRYAKRFISMSQKMQDELNSFTDPEVGHVYIGAGLTPSIYLLPQALAAYRLAHPRVQFQVRTGSSREITDALLQREIDLGVVTTFDPARRDLRGVPLLRDELLMVAAPGHPMVQEPAVSLDEALATPFVVMSTESGLRRLLNELSASRGRAIAVAMETDSLESISRLVQHGVGISCLPRSSAYDDIRAGRLGVIHLSDATLGARTITMVTRADSVIPACTEQFMEHLPRLVERVTLGNIT